MKRLQEKLQHKYALSEKGAKDMLKAFVSVTISDLVLMLPVWMLYFLVKDYLEGTMAGRGVFYIVGCLLCLAAIAVTTFIQSNTIQRFWQLMWRVACEGLRWRSSCAKSHCPSSGKRICLT